MPFMLKQFPRPGYAIVARALAPYLQHDNAHVWRESGHRWSRCSQLDASVWSAVSPQVATRLASVATQRAQSLVYLPPPDLAEMTVGDLAADGCDVLVVSKGTYGALQRAGVIVSGDAFYSLTLSRLFRVPGFGGKALLDLAASLETPRPVLFAAPENPRPVPSAARRVPRVTRSNPYVETFGTLQIAQDSFPRPGQAIVPRVLQSVFTPGFRIDPESPTWDSATRVEQSRTAESAARRLLAEMNPPRPPLADVRLSQVGRLEGRRLTLTRRTVNALGRAGLLTEEEGLADATLGQVWGVKGLGPRSILDLLTSLELESADQPVDDAMLYQASPCRDPLTRRAARIDAALEASGQSCFDPKVTRGPSGEFVAFVRAAASSARNAEIALSRFGWQEESTQTLEQLAQRFGLTRERVRQIVTKVQQTAAALAERVGTPHLDAVLARIEVAGGVNSAELDARLREEGLLEAPCCARDIALIARWLGKPTEASERLIESSSARDNERASHDTRLDQAIRRVARRYGAVRLDYLWTLLEQQDVGGHVEALREELRQRYGAEPLDGEGSWCWTAHCEVATTTLGNSMRKALSVAADLSLVELHKAASKNPRLNDRLPPFEVFVEMCKRTSWLVVQGHQVCAKTPISPEVVMEGDELAIVRLLLTYGPVLPVHDLWTLASSDGMGKVSFWMWLRNSPAISRVGPSLYALVGAEILATDLVRLDEQTRPKSATVMREWGRTPASSWASYRLSGPAIRTGRLRIPTPIRGNLCERYDVQVDEGHAEALFVGEGTEFRGLTHHFRRLGARPGDWLLIVIGGRAARLILGDEAAIRAECGRLSC